MIGRKIVDYFRMKRQNAAMMQTITDMHDNFYQACHGDFAYYPDVVYSYGYDDEKTAPEKKNDRRTGSVRLAYEG